MTDPILASDPAPQVPVLTLTLNPALDMATDVPRMVPDEKLRCSDPSLDPGGGGINVARAIHALGGESLALVALGGLTGDRLAFCRPLSCGGRRNKCHAVRVDVSEAGRSSDSRPEGFRRRR